MSHSFILLKPESAIYMKDIAAELEKEGYFINACYLITNYKLFAKEIYRIANYEKDAKYYEIIEACIEAEIILFGNRALLIEVQNEEDLLKHLIHLDRVKSKIRKRISLSKSKTLQAFIDVDKLKIKCLASSYGNIQILSNDKELQELYKSNTEIGNFVCFYLSYLHTIDAELDIYTKTMDFVKATNLLRKLQKDEFEIVLKYKTYHI